MVLSSRNDPIHAPLAWEVTTRERPPNDLTKQAHPKADTAATGVPSPPPVLGPECNLGTIGVSAQHSLGRSPKPCCPRVVVRRLRDLRHRTCVYNLLVSVYPF